MIARPEDEDIKAPPTVCDKCGSALGGKDQALSELYLTRLLLLSKDNVHSRVQFDRVYWQETVRMGTDGLVYTHAVGMHAPPSGVGSATFKIPTGAFSFTTLFGHAAQDGYTGALGNSIGRIFVDRILQVTVDIAGSQRILQIQVDIPLGAKELRLEVDAQGNHHASHTTWADPKYLIKLHFLDDQTDT